MPSEADLVIPRPWTKNISTRDPINAPPESHFTSTFGHLLPPVSYLTGASNAKIAYYSLPPITPNTPQGEPDNVLLFHGVQTPALGLLPLASDLQTSFPSSNFVLVDLYGHGLSDTPYLPHTPELFCDLIDRLLEHLKWQSAHLIGYSFGGITAVNYLASRPERVSSIALVAPAGLLSNTCIPTPHLRGDDETAAKEAIISFLEDGRLILPPNYQNRIAKGEVVAEALRDWQMREHAGHAASVVAIFRDGGVMGAERLFEVAAGKGVRSIVVLGELDGLVSEEGVRERGWRNVRVVGGAGHDVVRSRVPEVTGHISEFWEGLKK